MDKQELVNHFQEVSKADFERFGDFLKSPFFKVPKRIVRLYELINNSYQGDDAEPLTREIISKEFYPGKKFDDTQLNVRKLISDFKIYYHRFLAEKEFEENGFEQQLYILKQLRIDRNLKEYKRVLEDAKRMLCSLQTKDELYYRKMLDLISEQYEFEGYHYNEYSEDLSFEISEKLDLYFIAYKLFLSQRFEAREYALKTNIHKVPKFYEAVSKEIEENTDYYKQHPEIFCRYLIMKMNRDHKKSALYDEYLKYLNYAGEVLKVNCYSYYLDLLSHCMKMVNYGYTEFEKNIVRYAGIMENKGMFRNYGISYNDMKVIIESSIGSKKYDWGEEFIKNNIEFTEHHFRSSIYNLGLAKIYFFKKDYLSSRKHLVKVAYEDYLHYIDAKLIEARIEYEEKSLNGVLSIIDTVKKYLKAHGEIGDIYRDTYTAFVKFLNRLVRIYDAFTSGKTIDYEIEKLTGDIASYPNLLYGGEWILDKIKEFKKGRH